MHQSSISSNLQTTYPFYTMGTRSISNSSMTTTELIMPIVTWADPC